MHKKRTKALILSDMDTTTKGNKKRANKMTFSTFRQKTMPHQNQGNAQRLQKAIAVQQKGNKRTGSNTKRYHQAQALNATSKHYHQTLPLMGATRLASEK